MTKINYLKSKLFLKNIFCGSIIRKEIERCRVVSKEFDRSFMPKTENILLTEKVFFVFLSDEFLLFFSVL